LTPSPAPRRDLGRDVGREVREVKEWVVAGALLEVDDHLLLVRNVRRGGHTDWSTPGGVIDDTDVDVVAGLTREVEEETGLRVLEWTGPIYEVVADAPDLRWRMRCEVHLAVDFEGALEVADPDGIVTDAAFVPHSECEDRVSDCPPWVREPLLEWLAERWGAHEQRVFHYEVFGTDRASLRVVRADARR
jgi:8-oxo-dGTP diphosphatase